MRMDWKYSNETGDRSLSIYHYERAKAYVIRNTTRNGSSEFHVDAMD